MIQMVKVDKGDRGQLLSINLHSLLLEFTDVFEDPQGLPPSRPHDYQITLKEGTQSISTRPYRYPLYQKSEIEKIMKNLVETGLI